MGVCARLGLIIAQFGSGPKPGYLSVILGQNLDNFMALYPYSVPILDDSYTDLSCIGSDLDFYMLRIGQDLV